MSRIIQTEDRHYPSNAKELDILIFPHPTLKTVAQEVTEFNQDLKDLCQNMLKTMYHAPGIGLAAPQIGLSQRIFVLDVDYERKVLGDEDDGPVEIQHLSPQIFINPVITDRQGETTYEEGCLSIPGVHEEVKRSAQVEVRYQDVNGETHTLAADDLRAICIQHELDHLNGILFIEHLSRLKYNFIKKKFMKRKG